MKKTTDELVREHSQMKVAIKEAIRLVEKGKGLPAGSPHLSDWRPLKITNGFCLSGRVTGHPNFKDGTNIVTSVIVALGADLDWARSLNRFYALGTRHDDD